MMMRGGRGQTSGASHTNDWSGRRSRSRADDARSIMEDSGLLFPSDSPAASPYPLTVRGGDGGVLLSPRIWPSELNTTWASPRLADTGFKGWGRAHPR